MQYQQYAIEMELTGITRKQAAGIISEIFSKSYYFDNSQNIYTINDHFDRGWRIEKADGIASQKYAGDRVIGANDNRKVREAREAARPVRFKMQDDIPLWK